MMNCTAAERQDLTGVVYGDYMDGIEPIILSQGTDLSKVNLIK
jgi:hypothetical protein